jgi:hypothetical protein
MTDAGPEPQTVLVSTEGIDIAWVPSLPGYDFMPLDESGIRGDGRDITYYEIRDLEVHARSVSATLVRIVGNGSRGTYSGSQYRFIQYRTTWYGKKTRGRVLGSYDRYG